MLEFGTKVTLVGDLRISNVPSFFVERQPSEVLAYPPLIIGLGRKLSDRSWDKLFESVIKPNDLPSELRDHFTTALSGDSPVWFPSDVLINGYGLRVQMTNAEDTSRYEFKAAQTNGLTLIIRARDYQQHSVFYSYTESTTVTKRHIYLTKTTSTEKVRYILTPAADGVNSEMTVHHLS